MANEEEVKKLLAKVDAVTKEKKLDLSSDEDLSIAIMNLISIEEHLYFTHQKTGKDAYLELLNEVREMRKQLLKRIVVEYEGEVWCISKHLLASSMRLIEVGTKALGKGDGGAAKDSFEKAYRLYSLFWGLNLASRDPKLKASMGLGGKSKEKDDDSGYSSMGAPLSSSSSAPISGLSSTASASGSSKKGGFFDNLTAMVSKAVDCCKE